MINLNLIKLFIGIDIKHILVILLSIICLIFLLFIVIAKFKNDKYLKQLEDEKSLRILKEVELSRIEKDKYGKTTIITTVLGFNNKKSLEEALKSIGLKDFIKNEIGNSKNILLAEIKNNQYTLPSIKKEMDFVSLKNETYIYYTDTINPHFEFRDSVIINKDSCNIINVQLSRQSPIIKDTIKQVIKLGKRPKRILKWLNGGIGIGGEKLIISKTKHSNPYIDTKEFIIKYDKNLK